ncbi:MAG TPA: NAD(P)H-quinone oxidoreductase [Acidimicrobiales bacterium]|nr:NAD(P)H-quinone oxidoreductase [Acidimicrobiales bacterium]
MRALVIGAGGSLEVRERPDPVPGEGQILVAVRGAGLNAADLLQRYGLYPAPPGAPADIPGMEFAGEVVATGPGADRFKPGDRVMSLTGGGAQAELAVVHEREAMPAPAALSWAQAGGLPEAFTTAHDALFTQGDLRLGERLCVHGAAGGVGSAAVQLGVAAGASVVATVRSPERRESVASLGAVVVDPSAAVDNGPYDVILELIGAPNLGPDLETLATGGRIYVIGIGAGAVGEINLGLLMARRATIRGSTMRARPLEAKAAASRLLEAQVLPLFESGRLSVPVDAEFPLSEAEKAYEHFAEGGKFGKIVLTVD